MTSKSNDQQFCWERILEANSLFRVSHFFAPNGIAHQLLALHALFASIDLLSSKINDETVTRKKLDWWRFELLSGGIEKSRHPVLRYLTETGAAALLPEHAFRLLLDGAELRLDARSPSNVNEFQQLCGRIFQPRLALECALSGHSEELIPNNGALVSNAGLVELLRESSFQNERAFWWIPLSLMAHFQISRRELVDDRDSDTARAIICEILDKNKQFNSAEKTLVMIEKKPVLSGHIHLLLMANLQLRALGRLNKKKSSLHEVVLRRWHISDVISSWNYARQLEAFHQAV